MSSFQVPDRSRTGMSDDMEDAIPQEDVSETTNLFNERLRAFKHAVSYLEDYIGATEKYENAQSKEYEKVNKTVSQPLREGEHFDQNLGGISEMFDNIRTNTQSISNVHAETAKQLKGTVLPIFERLHSEIKNKQKEMAKTVSKSSKSVDKARSATQKHIELLGTATASHGALQSKPDPMNDPYIVQKGIYHRLHKQVGEENNARGDMLSVQNSFSQFEAHVVQSMQQGMGAFMTAVGTQLDQKKAMYTNMVQKTQQVNPVFEWNGFVHRNSNVLVDPNQPQRSVDNINFANKDHHTTQAMIQGSLERKAGLIKKWETSFYVVTPGKFLHQFKTEDNVQSDPSPELSLYLPDCLVGGCNGRKFDLKGKDVSKTGLGKAISGSKEYEFQAHTDRDADQWWRVIRDVAQGSLNNSQVTSPTSPASRSTSGAHAPYAAQGATTGAESRNVSGATTGTGYGAGSAPSQGTTSGMTTGTVGSGTAPTATGAVGSGATSSGYAGGLEQRAVGTAEHAAAPSHTAGTSGVSGAPGQY